jgi:hypothetical protein
MNNYCDKKLVKPTDITMSLGGFIHIYKRKDGS